MLATLAAVTRGLVPRVPITAKIIGIAGTSPAMTPSEWLDMSGNGISYRDRRVESGNDWAERGAPL